MCCKIIIRTTSKKCVRHALSASHWGTDSFSVRARLGEPSGRRLNPHSIATPTHRHTQDRTEGAVGDSPLSTYNQTHVFE
jgi:hypothetical protein